jgi:N-acyl-L-homoserine lactone synthetase
MLFSLLLILLHGALQPLVKPISTLLPIKVERLTKRINPPTKRVWNQEAIPRVKAMATAADES